MMANDRGTPEDHALDAIPAPLAKSPFTANVALPDGDKLVSFLVQVTREVWRLEWAVKRSRTRGEPISDEIQVTVERLLEDLESLGLQVNDPEGQTYTQGMRVEIAHLEPGGSGSLVIKRTVLPGVSLSGAILKPASVVVGREEAS